MQSRADSDDSGADAELDQTRESSPKIELYGTGHCPYCTAARLLLKKRGLDFLDISVASNDAARLEMQQRCGGRSVPQILINNRPIGGFDDLYALEQSGELDNLLLAGIAGKQK